MLTHFLQFHLLKNNYCKGFGLFSDKKHRNLKKTGTKKDTAGGTTTPVRFYFPHSTF